MSDAAEERPTSAPDGDSFASPPLTRRASSLRRSGVASGGDSPVLARKDSEIARLQKQVDDLEQRAQAADEQARMAARSETDVARRIARAVDAASRNYEQQLRMLQRLAGRADFARVEAEEATARGQLETDLLAAQIELVSEAVTRASTISEVQLATKPLRSHITAVNFQLRVVKALEQKKQRKLLADTADELKTVRDELEATKAELQTLREQRDTEPSRTEVDDSSDAHSEAAELRAQLDAANARVEHVTKDLGDVRDMLETAEAENLHLRTEARDSVALRTDAEAAQSQADSMMEALSRSETRRIGAEQSAAAARRALDVVANLGQSANSHSQSSSVSEAAVREMLSGLLRARQQLQQGDASDGNASSPPPSPARAGDAHTEDAEAAAAVEEDIAGEADSTFGVLQMIFGADDLRRQLLQSQKALSECSAQRDDAAAAARSGAAERVQVLEQDVAALQESYDRLDREAGKRLQTANELMGRIDEMRTASHEAEREHEERLSASRALQTEAENEAREALLARESTVRRADQLEIELNDSKRQVADALAKAHDAEARAEEAQSRAREQEVQERQRTTQSAADLAAREQAAVERALKAESALAEADARVSALTSSLDHESQDRAKAEAALAEVRQSTETQRTAAHEESVQQAAKIESLKQKVQSLTESLAAEQRHHTDSARDADTRHEATTHDLEATKDELSRVARELEEAREAHRVHRDRESELEAQVLALTRDLQEARDAADASKRTASHDLDAERDAIEAQREHYQSELVALSANAQRLEMHCAERVRAVETSAEERVDAAQSEITNLKARVAALEQELLDVTMSMRTAEGTAAEVREQKAAAERARAADLERHRAMIETADAKIDELRSAVTVAQRETVEARKEHREALAALESHKLNSAAQLVAVQRSHQREASIAEEKLNAAESRARALEGTIKRKTEKIDELSAELHAAQQRVDELIAAESRTSALSRDLETSLRQNAALQDRCEALRAEKDVMQQTVKESMSSSAATANEIQRMKLQIQDGEQRLASARQECADLRKELEAARRLVRTKEDATANASDALRREEAAHAMTRAELSTTQASIRATEQALRDAEQMNVDLMSRVAEVENSLDESRLTSQREAFSRMHVDAVASRGVQQTASTRSGLFILDADSPRHGASPSPIRSIAPDLSAAMSNDHPLQIAAFVELREAELRSEIVDFAAMFHGFVRRMRAVLDDAAQSERLERQRTIAERRRVRTLSDHVEALQAEAEAMQEAWKAEATGVAHEASIILMLEEAQGRRIVESAAFQGLSLVARDYLARPLATEARKVVFARREVELERQAANESVGARADTQRRLGECEATVSRVRSDLENANVALGRERAERAERLRDAERVWAAATPRLLEAMQADEAYCRWVLSDSALATLASIRTAGQLRSPLTAAHQGVGLVAPLVAADDVSKLQRQVAMWRSRCHAIVELEKASLDSAIETAVRSQARTSAPRPQSLVTLQTLEQSQRRLLQQTWFETQSMLLTMAGYF